MAEDRKYQDLLENRGIGRRDFLKYCGVIAAAMGLDSTFVPRIAEALTTAQRPPIIWLHFSECTGCTEAFLRSSNPFVDVLLLDSLSVDYHETLMAPSGAQAEALRTKTLTDYAGKFFCVVEGSIPTAENGNYGRIGDKTMLQIAQEVCTKSYATIAIGSCSSYGGLAAASPNPTGAKGVKDALGGLMTRPVVNIPGCPPNPVTFVATITNYLLKGTLPALDSSGRPTFSYGKSIHDQCPYHEGDEDRCVKERGCRGPKTRYDCPSIKFNDGTSWCVQAGHPCIGCSEPGFWDMGTFYKEAGQWGDGSTQGEGEDSGHSGDGGDESNGSHEEHDSPKKHDSHEEHSSHDEHKGNKKRGDRGGHDDH